VVNGTAKPANQEIVVPATQLAQVTYLAGTAADSLSVRANDGTQWGAWASFTVTGQPPVNTPAVVTPLNANIVALSGQTFAASSLFTASDPDGDTIRQYDLRDTGTGGGRFLVNGGVKSANRDIIVSATQLAQVAYRAGKGTDTLSVRANDGTQWGAWSNFTVTGLTASHISPFSTSAGEDALRLGWNNGSGLSGHEPSFLTHS
jgi:hypothetical protein